VRFKCYPIQHWKDPVTGDNGFTYRDTTDPDGPGLKAFDEDKVVQKLEGTVCWRGCWEERLYFTDSEYWGDELSEMYHLYKHVLQHCKEHIMAHCKYATEA